MANLLWCKQVRSSKECNMMIYSILLSLSIFFNVGCFFSDSSNSVNTKSASSIENTTIDPNVIDKELDSSQNTLDIGEADIHSVEVEELKATRTADESKPDKIEGKEVVNETSLHLDDEFRETGRNKIPEVEDDSNSADSSIEIKHDEIISDSNTVFINQEEDEDEEIVAPNVHEAWQKILSKYVSGSGVVNYSGLLGNIDALNEYLSQLSSTVPSSSDRSIEAKAFWMNAYNAFTIKLILNHFPVKSIREIDGGSPWDTKWIKLGSSTYSLNNIEHDIIRKYWKDGRIHFAVNCAAKSCPPISNRAFTKANTEKLLEELTRKFISNKDFNDVSPSKLELSKIFEWYKEDFGDLSKFIDKYTTIKVSNKANVSYKEYNWSLNGH